MVEISLLSGRLFLRKRGFDGEVLPIPVPGVGVGSADLRKFSLTFSFLRTIRRRVSLGSQVAAYSLLLFSLPLPQPRLPRPPAFFLFRPAKHFHKHPALPGVWDAR